MKNKEVKKLNELKNEFIKELKQKITRKHD